MENQGWLHCLIERLKQYKHFVDHLPTQHDQVQLGIDKFNVFRIKVKDEMKSQEQRQLKEALLTSKHRFAIHVWPNWYSKRPWEIDILTIAEERVLVRWVLSEHFLEVETARFRNDGQKVPLEDRTCKKCKEAKKGCFVGNEFHVLTECCQHELTRTFLELEIQCALGNEHVTFDNESSALWYLLPLLHELKHPNNLWKEVAQLLIKIDCSKFKRLHRSKEFRINLQRR